MEPTNTVNRPRRTPFEAASRFGTGLPLEWLAGWQIQFTYDGDHTYAVRTDGERVLMSRAPQA